MPHCERRLLRLASGFCLIALCSLLTSCGQEDFCYVTGTVRLDGKPLADAVVQFNPTNAAGPKSASESYAGASYSNSATDANGWYNLKFSRSRLGVLPGTHRVEIWTSYDWGGPGIELVPPKYRGEKSTLSKEVSLGSHVIDFDLSSDGYEPAKGRKAPKK